MSDVLKRVCRLAAFALVITLLCIHSVSSAKVYGGNYGKHTKWYYDTNTKTVTIDCQGKMEGIDDHCGLHKEWSANKWYTKAERVVFRRGITHIGAGAFEHFMEVEEVVLPEGLVSIGRCAFRHTDKLKKIQLPSSLKKIGTDAFSESGLEAVSLKNVETIGIWAFAGTNLKELTINSQCRKIKESAFWYCRGLKKIKIENGVKTIGQNAFSVCGFESVTIPASVTKIGTDAFYSLSPEEGKLKRVTIKSIKITKWGKHIFGDARKDLVIRVPEQKKEEYTKALREGGLPAYVKIVGV